MDSQGDDPHSPVMVSDEILPPSTGDDPHSPPTTNEEAPSPQHGGNRRLSDSSVQEIHLPSPNISVQEIHLHSPDIFVQEIHLPSSGPQDERSDSSSSVESQDGATYRPCMHMGVEDARNLVVCIDGTANQFGLQVSPRREVDAKLMSVPEYTRRRTL